MLARGAPGILLILLAEGASAWEITPGEHEALAERVVLAEMASNSLDYLLVFDLLPPRLRQEIANRGGVSLQEARRRFAAEQQGVVQALRLAAAFSLEIDIGAVKCRELADGTRYALIPSEIYVEIEGVAARALVESLAILEEGEWYFVSTEEADDWTVFLSAYPLFAGVQFSEAVFEVIEP